MSPAGGQGAGSLGCPCGLWADLCRTPRVRGEEGFGFTDWDSRRSTPSSQAWSHPGLIPIHSQEGNQMRSSRRDRSLSNGLNLPAVPVLCRQLSPPPSPKFSDGGDSAPYPGDSSGRHSWGRAGGCYWRPVGRGQGRRCTARSALDGPQPFPGPKTLAVLRLRSPAPSKATRDPPTRASHPALQQRGCPGEHAVVRGAKPPATLQTTRLKVGGPRPPWGDSQEVSCADLTPVSLPPAHPWPQEDAIGGVFLTDSKTDPPFPGSRRF